jgi:predicted transport protein
VDARNNSSYSDKPFLEKRNMQWGFIESPLRLNKEIANKEHWGEKEIISRAEILSTQAAKVWIGPIVEKEILATYKAKEEVTTEYTINDHPYLVSEPLHSLFEKLRKEILALDPVITETFLKLYVAYKAETNFVDIVPQAKRLRLSLNISFVKINDPKGLCKDVSALGRWGNGDVEVGLSSIKELPYVMGLIRQALEAQMGQDDLD